MAQHYVSPSALSEFRKCRRCFWLDRNKKIKRPRGAFPTLPGGIDRVLKAYFDQHRQEGTLPEEIRVAVPKATTLFEDQAQITAMRNARKPLLTCVIGNVKLVGGLDELLVIPDQTVAPFDYKTKGSAIKPEADPFEYYRMQLNDYGLLLQAFGLTLSGKGYLGYWSPMTAEANEGTLPEDHGDPVTLMTMRCQVFSMALDLEAARAEVVAAGVCLDGELPEASPECEVCAFVVAAAGA